MHLLMARSGRKNRDVTAYAVRGPGPHSVVTLLGALHRLRPHGGGRLLRVPLGTRMEAAGGIEPPTLAV